MFMQKVHMAGALLLISFLALFSAGCGDNDSAPTDTSGPVTSLGTDVIKDTGQTKSYTDIFGEDSDYILNPPSYTKLGPDGQEPADSATEWAMVRDNVTGLIWEVKTDDGAIHDMHNTYDWLTARFEYVNRLNQEAFGGYTDWRLPYIRELSGLVCPDNYYPAIDTSYFPNLPVPDLDYWSYDIVSSIVTQAFFVRFGYGSIYIGDQTDEKHVRAVRGEAAWEQDDYHDNEDGTVSDGYTGLMWQQATADAEMTWEEAVHYCENLSLAGHTDWRLPNRNELQSLVDKQPDASSWAAISTTFPDTYALPYWTSTSHALAPGHAWTVSFAFGQMGPFYLNEHHNYVRAVRGGNIQTANEFPE